MASFIAADNGARANRTVLGRKGPAVLDGAVLHELALPGEHDRGRDVPHLARAEAGADVHVRVVAVVEPGLGRETGVGVHAVEVQVQEFVDGQQLRARAHLPGVDLAHQRSSFTARVGGCAVATLGDLHPLAGEWLVAEGDLEVQPPRPSAYTP
jgi:hypothetical protein